MRNTSRRGAAVAMTATCVLVAPMVTTLSAARMARAQQAAPAPVPAAAERLVTLDLRDARLEAAVTALLQQSGGAYNVVLLPSNGKSYGLVNVKLVDQPLSRVLQAVAASAGATVTQVDGIYNIGPRTENDLTISAKAAATQPTPTVAAAVAQPAAPRAKTHASQYQLVKLNYVLPSEFLKEVDDPRYLNLVGNLDVKLAPRPMFEPSEAPGPSGISNQVLGQGPSNTTSPGTNGPAAGSSGTGTGGSAGRDGNSYGEAGQVGVGIGGQGGGFRGFGGQGAGGFGGQGGAPGAPGGAGGQAGQASLRPPGILNLISNDSDNALLVEYDDVDDLNRLREIIRLLDVAPRQVMIRAEFVSVDLTEADAFGINWQFQPAGNIDVTIPPANASAPTVGVTYASGNAVASLRAALLRTTGNLLQAPIITTSNNRLANITVSTQQSIQQSVVIPVLNGTPITSTTQVPITATNGLTVLPHINGDNSISLALTPQLQSIQLRADGGFTRTNESLTTYRRVQNGETMVLGGFITKQQIDTVQEVPFLSKLPIIGNLFSQRDRNQTGSETLVFITPTIIEDRSQGIVGSGGGSTPPSP